MKRHTDRLKSEGVVGTSINFEEKSVTITMNLEMIKYHRNRSGMHSTYDPMSSYKRNLKAMITKSLNSNDISIPEDWKENPLEVECYFVNTPTKSGNGIGKIALMLKNLVMRTKYPDVDNFTKTAFDVLNTLAWIDDAQVVSSTSKKLYGYEEKTVIVIKYLDDFTDTVNIQELLKLGIVSEEDIEYARKIKNS